MNFLEYNKICNALPKPRPMQITNSMHAQYTLHNRLCVCYTHCTTAQTNESTSRIKGFQTDILTRVMEVRTDVSISNLSISRCVIVTSVTAMCCKWTTIWGSLSKTNYTCFVWKCTFSIAIDCWIFNIMLTSSL